jgi:hypothetical protein
MKRFPRWRLFQRHLTGTEATLGSLPMVILTPIIAAVIAAAWAASAPTREVVRRGVVVGQASFFDVLLSAAFGALLGIALVVVGVALKSVVSYHLRGDPSWEVRWDIGKETPSPAVTTTRNDVRLVCVTDPPIDVTTLGYVDAVVRLPTGEWRRMPQNGLGPIYVTPGPNSPTNGWYFQPVGSPSGPFPPGGYEVRWYGTTARGWRFEIARSRHTVR